MTEDWELLDRYTRSMKASGASARTIGARVRVAEMLLNLHPTGPQDITTADLAEWLGRDDLAQWSRCTYHGHAKSFLGWLVSEGVLSENPIDGIKRPKTPRQRPKPLTLAEQERVLALAHGNQRAWLLLALLAGLRAHEIAKVRGEDVQQDVLFVSGKGGVEAYLPTYPQVWALAQQYPRHGWWFPSRAHDGHISADTVTIMTGRLFRAAGIPEGSIHRARHSYATTLLRSGADIRDVQTLMRHASIATTAGYCAVDEDRLRAVVNRLPPVA